MQQLFDFIFGNPLLLFIVIGALINFVQRGKQPDAKREPQKRSTTTSQEQREEVDWREIFRQEADPKPKPTRQQTYTYTEEIPTVEVNRSQELLEKYEKAKRRKEAEKTTKVPLKDSPIYTDDLTASKKASLDFSRLTREDAMKGIIWSEVLGKPRSKGSYRPTLTPRRK